MKRKLFFSVLCLVITGTVFAQEKTGKWDYPVKPGMNEWLAFKSIEGLIMIYLLFMNRQNHIVMNKFTATLFVLCLFCQCSNNAEEKNSEERINTLSASGSFLPVVDDSYVYPVIPGTDAWTNLGTTENVYKVSQLPDNVLNSISTLGLIRSILDIPGLDGFYLASSNSSPIGTCYRIFEHYNSIRELEKRKDSGNKLISFYNAVNIDGLKSLSVGERIPLSVQHTILEVLFTKPEILRQFDLEQKKQLITALLSRYNQITQSQFEGFIANGTMTVIARILYDSKFDPVVQYYGNNAVAEYFKVLTNQMNDIIEFANNFIHN